MHRSSNRESLKVVAARSPGGDLLGSTFQLRIRLHNFDWLNYAGLDWGALFCYEIVHETRSIQLVHWFDFLAEPTSDVGPWSTEIVTWEVTLPLVVGWDIIGHGDQSGNIG